MLHAPGGYFPPERRAAEPALHLAAPGRALKHHGLATGCRPVRHTWYAGCSSRTVEAMRPSSGLVLTEPESYDRLTHCVQDTLPGARPDD